VKRSAKLAIAAEPKAVRKTPEDDVMPTLMERVKSLFEAPPAPPPLEEGPDGSREVLRSGRWAIHQLVPKDAFPLALLLNEADQTLIHHVSEEIVLAEMTLGREQVELLVCVPEHDVVSLALRIPTAATQFKDPYVLLEAEAGNTREDAVREINFHLVGRIPEEIIGNANWRDFFRAAALKLEDLRTIPAAP
jgi:hypothetical protein